MPIVKCTNKKGQTYAYRSTSFYDPVKKASRPRREYLGRVDPITGNIIPKRKRTKKQMEGSAGAPGDSEITSLRSELLKVSLQVQQCEDKIREQSQEIVRLQGENRKMREKLDVIHRNSAPMD